MCPLPNAGGSPVWSWSSVPTTERLVTCRREMFLGFGSYWQNARTV
jgi:hypothetical protein